MDGELQLALAAIFECDAADDDDLDVDESNVVTIELDVGELSMF